MASSLNARADAVNGALELAEQAGWEPADTVAALPGMDQRAAHTPLSALQAGHELQQESGGA
ncbi:hypothetical protein [Streptomyces sp. NPDC087859]|uniref:hypothetical protein n=1 Tax=Streptomyces sp. NPDC087859 TaxID=3365812 RepID=UPI00380393CA